MADAKVEIKGGEELSERFQQLLGLLGEKLMGEIGMFLMTRIKTRTAAGKDVEGAFFKPYSARYAFFRHSKGRPVDKVDLFFTGSMLANMDMEVSPARVRVFFAPSRDNTGMSNPEKAYYLNQNRRFFAISDQDQKDIGQLVLDALHET